MSLNGRNPGIVSRFFSGNFKSSQVPVPDEEEAVDVAAIGVVFKTVGDGLANLAGLGGVAGGVEDVFGVSDDLAFGFASDVDFSSVGFFAVG